MQTEMTCRACGAADVELRYIWKPDGSGRLVPVAAECTGPCAGRTLPPEPEPEVTAWPAIGSGTCYGCPEPIEPGQLITLRGRKYYHARCERRRD